MNKTVLVISSSPRKRGNSDLLCDEFIRGAENAGNKVEKIFLGEKEIHYCSGCGACIHTRICPQRDDMPEVFDKMIVADVIVLASPVYFYTMCGQLKTLIDRCCSGHENLANKEFYYIITAADPMPDAIERTVNEFQGFLYCLDNPRECGIICGTGVMNQGDVKNREYMQEAYEMGQGV